jgi:hypothetical protein
VLYVTDVCMNFFSMTSPEFSERGETNREAHPLLLNCIKKEDDVSYGNTRNLFSVFM